MPKGTVERSENDVFIIIIIESVCFVCQFPPVCLIVTSRHFHRTYSYVSLAINSGYSSERYWPSDLRQTESVSYQVSKVKVKVTPVQALRLCTGRTAHRGSRGIALPFHDHGNRRE